MAITTIVIIYLLVGFVIACAFDLWSSGFKTPLNVAFVVFCWPLAIIIIVSCGLVTLTAHIVENTSDAIYDWWRARK